MLCKQSEINIQDYFSIPKYYKKYIISCQYLTTTSTACVHDLQEARPTARKDQEARFHTLIVQEPVSRILKTVT